MGAVALVLVVAMSVMGWWQLGTYDSRQQADAEEALDQPPVPLDEVLGPDDGFPADGVARPVTAEGTYRAAEQMYVESGGDYQVVTPLVTASGSAILVVRGSATQPGDTPPRGNVVVEGVLEPSTSDGASLDENRVTDGLRISRLVEGFDLDLYGGYVVLQESQPPEDLTPVDPPLPDPSIWVGFRNLMYALQWWVFAAFVVFMWWRIVGGLDDRPGERVG